MSEANSILAQMRQLSPPAVSKPDYHAQVAALRRMSAASGRLAASLQSGPSGNVQAFLRQFDRAATSAQPIA